MVYPLTKFRTAIAAVGVLASCLLVPAVAESASAPHKAHSRSRCAVCRRVVSPKQAFKRIATRRPDRLVRRHVTALIRTAHTAHRGSADDAAIQNISTVSLEADLHASPALESIGVLVPEHAQLKTHEGLARRAPRGPPAFS